LTPAEESELNVAIDRIGSAYHSTFGDAMPSPWRTDIVREFKTGNRASLSRINPERLASVAAACDDKKTIFCLSNVIRAIHAAARAAKIAEDIHRKTIEKSSQDAAAKAAEDKARAEAEEITTARVERFRKLPEVERDTWNTKALDLPGPPIKHLGRLERIAAMLYAEANEPNSNRPTAREGTA
jgi:hypothetical protein